MSTKQLPNPCPRCGGEYGAHAADCGGSVTVVSAPAAASLFTEDEAAALTDLLNLVDPDDIEELVALSRSALAKIVASLGGAA